MDRTTDMTKLIVANAPKSEERIKVLWLYVKLTNADLQLCL